MGQPIPNTGQNKQFDELYEYVDTILKQKHQLFKTSL